MRICLWDWPSVKQLFQNSLHGSWLKVLRPYMIYQTDLKFLIANSSVAHIGIVIGGLIIIIIKYAAY